MKKLFLLSSITLPIFLSAMQNSFETSPSLVQSQAIASQEACSLQTASSLDTREKTINYFYKEIDRLRSAWSIIKKECSTISDEDAAKKIEMFIQDAQQVGDKSVQDLNRDEFQQWLSNELAEALAAKEMFQEKQKLQEQAVSQRAKKIKMLKEQEAILKHNFNGLPGHTEIPTEHKISILDTWIDKARCLSSTSELELREVEFAHKIAPFIRSMERYKDGLQKELASVKREIKSDDDSSKQARRRLNLDEA